MQEHHVVQDRLLQVLDLCRLQPLRLLRLDVPGGIPLVEHVQRDGHPPVMHPDDSGLAHLAFHSQVCQWEMPIHFPPHRHLAPVLLGGAQRHAQLEPGRVQPRHPVVLPLLKIHRLQLPVFPINGTSGSLLLLFLLIMFLELADFSYCHLLHGLLALQQLGPGVERPHLVY